MLSENVREGSINWTAVFEVTVWKNIHLLFFCDLGQSIRQDLFITCLSFLSPMWICSYLLKFSWGSSPTQVVNPDNLTVLCPAQSCWDLCINFIKCALYLYHIWYVAWWLDIWCHCSLKNSVLLNFCGTSAVLFLLEAEEIKITYVL